MYANLPQLSFFLDTERIIKVLGIFRINSASKYVAEVLTATDFLRRDAGINLLGSVLNLFGILVRQTVLRQDGVHLHIVVALFAQDVDYLTNDIL